jgi:hypothetical protein
VRLEMRTVAGMGLGVAALAVSVSCCCKPKLTGDIVSGVPKGSALVKVLITLTEKETTPPTNPRTYVCTGTVNPPTAVVVFPGSAIRWKVVNGCKNSAKQFLEFTRPMPKQQKTEGSKPEAWSFAFCKPHIDLYTADDPRNVLFCEVPDNVVPGLYKYGLQGAWDYDPDVDVHKGGK